MVSRILSLSVFSFCMVFGARLLALDFIENLLGGGEQDLDSSQELIPDTSTQTNPLAKERPSTPPVNIAAKKGDDLSQSIIGGLAATTLKQFQQATHACDEEGNRPLIAHLLELNPNPLQWRDLVSFGLAQKRFSSPDIAWMLRELYETKTLTKKMAAGLWETLLDNSKNQNRASELRKLLTDVSIPKPAGTLNNLMANRAHSQNEKCNVLIMAVEHNYREAFLSILDAFPDFASDISNLPSVEREESTGTLNNSGWMRGANKYEKVTYSFVAWLMRDRGEEKNLYIDRSKSAQTKNNNYIWAGQEMARFMLKDGEVKFDQACYDMITLLFKQNDLKADEMQTATKRLQL